MMKNNLPENWIVRKLGEVYQVVKEKGVEGRIPYLEIGNVNIETKSYQFTGKAAVKGVRRARKGDVLVSRVRPTRGAIAYVNEDTLEVSSAFTNLRGNGKVDGKYLFYYLAWNSKFLSSLGENSTGTMYPTVAEQFIFDYQIPIAPFVEQQRIVAKLDELMEKMHRSRARLERVPKILKRFRQSILLSAVTGRLTEDWRNLNHPDESAIDYVNRIKAFADPVGTIDEETPETWINVRFGEVFDIVRGSSPRPKGDPRYFSKTKTAHHWIMLSDFTDNTSNNTLIDTNEYLTEEGSKYGRYVNKKDILVGVSGVYGVGRTCLLDIEGYIYDGIMAIKGVNDQNLRKFINYFMQLQRMKLMEVSTGTSWPNINTDILRNYICPIPPPREQAEIVRKVEKFLSLADKIETRYNKALAYLDMLPQSLITKAFSGQLVSGDEKDEPATVWEESKLGRRLLRMEKTKTNEHK